jgi:hypothetical protein
MLSTIHAFSRDSVIGVATSYGPGDQGFGVRVPVGDELSVHHFVQTGSEVHPTSYLMGTGGFSPGVKRSVREAEHSPPASAEVMKMWAYTYTTHRPSWRSAYLVKYRYDFNFFTSTMQTFAGRRIIKPQPGQPRFETGFPLILR